MHTVDIKLLQKEVDEISAHLFPESFDKRFTYWFFRAYITDDNDKAKASVCGGSNDKGIDGVFIDDDMQIVYLLQTKYHQSLMKVSEKKEELIKFSKAFDYFTTKEEGVYLAFISNMEGGTAKLIRTAHNRVHKRKYTIKMLFVTTGKKDIRHVNTIENQIKVLSADRDVKASFHYLSGEDIIRILQDFIDGVAPPIPEIELELERDKNIQLPGAFQRYDNKNKIESWVVTMSGDKVAGLYKKSGVRIFARNIRGFLGVSGKGINAKMKETLINDPDKFYYYNNGVTIVCDEAKKISESGRTSLLVSNPQIINGQQTTRVLSDVATDQAKKVSVIVKVVSVQRLIKEEKKNFDALVSKIVSGTNSQNAISQSDLISNDTIQIELQRRLRPLNYNYLRKKSTKTEAKQLYGSFGGHYVNKDEFAKASAATQFDQQLVRLGVNHLYNETNYDNVFPNSEPYFYLPRYWLMKRVTKLSKNAPEWGYSKWMIIGFVWHQITKSLQSNKRKIAFTTALEDTDPKLLKSLDKMVMSALKGSSVFYKKNSGKGKSRIDPSQFYKNKKGRNKEFEKFWKSEGNKHRIRFEKAKQGFELLITSL